jgi:hypothetical protein
MMRSQVLYASQKDSREEGKTEYSEKAQNSHKAALVREGYDGLDTS